MRLLVACFLVSRVVVCTAVPTMSELRGGILLTTHGIETAAAYRRRRAQAAGLPSNNQLRNEGTEGEPGVDSYNITLNQSSMDGISVDWKKNGTEPLTFAAVVARVLPSTMSAFVTLFGTKISTVVRISSVFWASASALAMPAIKELRDTGQFTVDVFLSLAGGVYAGSVGSFVAVKKRGFGILVQGMALGAIISDMCKGFVMAWVVEQVPEAKHFLDWIDMIFTFGVGLSIGKFAQKHEDLISVCATAIIGAYVQMQVFVSFGFSWCASLSVEAAMDDRFGCDPKFPACYALLVVTVLYGLCGAYNQTKMNVIMKAMEDPDKEFTPTTKYEKRLVKVNEWLGIIFQFNDLINMNGAEDLTPEQKKELERKTDGVITKLATAGSDIGLVCLSATSFVGIVEGAISGCFPSSSKVLMLFAAYLFLLGLLSEREDEAKKRYRGGWFLTFGMFLIPMIAFATGIIAMSGLAGESPIQIVQVREYFDFERQPGEPDLIPEDSKDCLRVQMPTMMGTLVNLLTVLCVAWFYMCKYMGGAAYLAARLTTMVSYTLLVIGIPTSLAGYYLGRDKDEFADVFRRILYDVMFYIGFYLSVIALIGCVGVHFKVKGGVREKLGLLLLNIFRACIAFGLLAFLLLTAATSYYFTQLDERGEADYEKLKEAYPDSWEVMQKKLRFTTKASFLRRLESGLKVAIIVCAVVDVLLIICLFGATVLANRKGQIKDLEMESDDEQDNGNSGDHDRDQAEKPKKKKKKKKTKKKGKLIGVADERSDDKDGDSDKDQSSTDVTPVNAKATKKADKDEQALRSLWNLLDLDGSDLLNLEETRAVFSAMGHQLPEKKFERTYKQIDVNGNGEIEFEELLVWWCKQKAKSKKMFASKFAEDSNRPTPGGDKDDGIDPTEETDHNGKAQEDEEETELLAVWGMIDSDGSGLLSQSETKAVFEAMGYDISDKKFAKEFKKIDTDESGEICSNELLTWWRKQKAKSRNQFGTEFAAITEKSEVVREPDKEEKRLQAIWDLVDADHSGTLDHEEVRKIFMGMGQNLTDKKFSAAWKKLDTDSSGVIDFIELLVWWRAQKGKDKSSLEKLLEDQASSNQNSGRTEESTRSQSAGLESASLAEDEVRLQVLWSIVDKDESSFLDEEEVAAVFTAMGKELSKKKLAKAFVQMDMDGSGEIEFAELLSWWRKQKKKHKALLESSLNAGPDEQEQQLQAIWDVIDGDGSGFLDRAEVRKVLEIVDHKLGSDNSKFKAVWNEIDADGSGEIEFSELLVWWRRQKKKAKKTFQSDADGMEQLKAAAAAAGPPIPFMAEWTMPELDVSGHLDKESLAVVLGTLVEGFDGRARHRLNTAVEIRGRVKLLFEIERDAKGAVHRGTGGAGGDNKHVQQIWDAVDVDGNGALDRDELHTVLDRLGKKLSPKRFEKMFAELDPAKSGKIYYPMFAAWCIKQDRKKLAKAATPAATAQAGETELAEIKALWSRFDTDNSGVLEAEEVRAVLRASGKSLSGAETEEAIRMMDKDGDQTVDFDEFVAWWESQDPKAREQLRMLEELNFDEL